MTRIGAPEGGSADVGHPSYLCPWGAYNKEIHSIATTTAGR